MKKLLMFYNKYKWTLTFFAGLFAVGIYCCAYFILGDKSYVQITDQLDGEVINYIYHAKYLFSGQSAVAEFMNGMDLSAMTPPAPLGVLFYKILPPFAAFATMHIFSVTIGYIGMFLLGKLISNNPFIVLIVSCLFIYLPFYPVYGLSVLGQPLLLWACAKIYQNPHFRMQYYGCIFLYGIASSFVLVGYAWLILLGIGIIVSKLFHHNKEKSLSFFSCKYFKVFTMFGTLFLTYLICNTNLLKSFLGFGSNYAFHREEMVISPIYDWWDHFTNLLLEGAAYVKSYNVCICILAGIIILYTVLKHFICKQKVSTKCILLYSVFSITTLIAFLSSCWRLPAVVEWRVSIGGLFKYFQFDRISWLLPLCWFITFILALDILFTLKDSLRGTIICCFTGMLSILIMCNTVYKNSPIYHNLRLMIFPETYHLMTWEDYYAEEVYTQIKDYIYQTTNETPSEYRVVSLGVNPATALYNGFYCLDGYSNLYSLEYKHEFRKIIEKELDKSDETRVYFDTWGNRCYLLNSETGNYMTVARDSGSYTQLELNTKQLCGMGGKYIFSAMPIENAEDMGLSLLRETPFSTETSYYEVWVYSTS